MAFTRMSTRVTSPAGGDPEAEAPLVLLLAEDASMVTVAEAEMSTPDPMVFPSAWLVERSGRQGEAEGAAVPRTPRGSLEIEIGVAIGIDPDADSDPER